MDDFIQNERTLVQGQAIKELIRLGYRHMKGSQLEPVEGGERERYSDVALKNILFNKLKVINPEISDENIYRTIREITTKNYPSLLEANHDFYKKLIGYISKEENTKAGKKSQTLKFIDFENIEKNDFLVVDELVIKGPNENIRPDLTIFINGLPLAVIECKSPFSTGPIEEGINQLRRYSNTRGSMDIEGAPKLFYFNQIMVSDCRDHTYMGTITSTQKHYLPWKDTYPYKKGELGEDPSNQKIVLYCIFRKDAFLDIIQNFILFDKGIKKIPRYQQYRAVQKTLKRLKGEDKNSLKENEKGGIIWHTQGSGKSLTMVFLVNKMRSDPQFRKYKIVFVTDRTDLDKQLSETIKECQDETVLRAKNVKEFKELLKKDSSDIVTGMLQKFQENELENFPVLNTSEKIIILIDEAHRGQFKSLASNIGTGLPNAPKIGFTGTPLIRDDKNFQVFGDYIDTYKLQESVKDGATLNIYYEGREAIVKISDTSLDELFEKTFTGYTQEQKDEILKKYGTEKAILEAPSRIEAICKDIIQHYNETIKPNGFKAQIVTNSRRAAILYHEKIKELGGPESAVIISGLHNDEEFYKRYTDSKIQKVNIERFKKPLNEEPLAFLIVKDQLLTGFDAPIEQVMYIDRKLKEHTLLQAIARVNRTFKDKKCGYIVDYYGLSGYLKEALSMYSGDALEDMKKSLIPLEEEIPKLERRHQKVLQHFKGLNLNDTDKCILHLKDDRKRAEFEIDFKNFLTSMNIILPNKAATPFIKDMNRLGKISKGAKNKYREPQLELEGVGDKIRSMIDEYIQSTGVDPKIPPLKLFSDTFIENLEKIQSIESKACELEYAIKAHIKIKYDENPVFYKKLGEKLSEILKKQKDNWEELYQMLMKFFEEDVKTGEESQAKKLGLNQDELAFYNILKEEHINKYPEKIGDKISEARYLTLSVDLYKELEKATKIVDFFNKSQEKKKIEREIKYQLIDSSLFEIEDKRTIKRINEQFMELAKVKFQK